MSEKQAAAVAEAVFNNALWCDTVCRAYDRPGQFLDGIWLNRWETPPFFPNAVTLDEAQRAGQMAQIEGLLRGGLTGEWGVKDSFCTLDLAPLGFVEIFVGQWIVRDGSAPVPEAVALPGVHWTIVRSDQALARWEGAWRGDAAGPATSGGKRIFLPALLRVKGLTFVAAVRDGEIVGGAVASRSRDVIGLSNLFVPLAESLPFRAGCVAAIAHRFPGTAMVGYEGGMDLAEMEALGFTEVGPLRIWVRPVAAGR